MLATLFGNPGRSYKVGELAAASGMSASTAGREVERARTAGVVTVEELGNARLVRANLDHPLAEPLGRILVATFGVPAVIAEEFSDLDGVTSVMVFGLMGGSLARRRRHRSRRCGHSRGRRPTAPGR